MQSDSRGALTALLYMLPVLLDYTCFYMNHLLLLTVFQEVIIVIMDYDVMFFFLIGKFVFILSVPTYNKSIQLGIISTFYENYENR